MNPAPRNFLSFGTFWILLAVTIPSAAAVTVVDDHFDSPWATPAGLEIPFRKTNNSATLQIVAAAGAYLLGNVFRLQPFGGNRGGIGTLYGDGAYAPAGGLTQSSFVLGSQVGDSIALTFDFAFANANGTGTGNNDWLNGTTVGNTTFKFGLYNSNGSPALTDTTTDPNNDSGYFATIGVKGTSASTFTKESGTNSSMTAGTDLTLLSGTYTDMAAANQLRYSVAFTLERTVSGVDLDFTVYQGASLLAQGSASDNSGIYTTFDEAVFWLGSGANRHDFRMDNMVIDVVPEPCSAVLLSLGTICFLTSRRR